VVAPLVDFLIASLNPSTWAPLLGQQPAAAACAGICAHLLQHGMYPALSCLLTAAAAAAAAAAGAEAGGALARPGSTSFVEALATQLTARHIALKAPVAEPALGPQHLLLVPQVWDHFPSLRPISGHIGRAAVAQLAALPAARVAEQLPHGARARGAALLAANLVQAGPKVLQGDSSVAGAAQLVHVLSVLLALLPLKQLFPSAADEEEEQARAAAGLPASSGPVAALGWQPGDGSAAEVAAELSQLWDLPGKALLLQLAQVLLPCTGLPQAPRPLGPAGRQLPAAFSAERYGAGWAFCCLLRQLLSLRVHRQKLLLGIAVSGGLVGRLWYSMVQPAQQLLAAGADLGGLVLGPAAAAVASSPSTPAAAAPAAGAAAGAGTCRPGAWRQLQDPGLLLPLLVLSQAFSSFMATADLDSFYQQQQPLALAQLAPAGAPDQGLVPLLNTTLWRVLWLEADKQPAGADSGRLRLEVSEHCGRLLEQLYDRNCRCAARHLGRCARHGLAAGFLLLRRLSARPAGRASLRRWRPCSHRHARPSRGCQQLWAARPCARPVGGLRRPCCGHGTAADSCAVGCGGRPQAGLLRRRGVPRGPAPGQVHGRGRQQQGGSRGGRGRGRGGGGPGRR
jgi:hypothetical protein